MSSRPYRKPHSVITNGNMAGSLTGVASIISNQSITGYAFSWSGSSPVGGVTAQVSNDYSLNTDGSIRDAGTWTTLLDSAGAPITGAVSGNTGNGFFNVAQIGSYAIRPVYTRTSGTGTLQCKVVTKVS